MLKEIVRLTKSQIFLSILLLSPCYYSQDVTYLHTWPQKWRVIHHLFWDFLLLRADIRRQICVACQPGYSCHNALQYIRYVRGHIHFVPYITIGKRYIHKFFQLEEMKFCHIWGWKIPWPNWTDIRRQICVACQPGYSSHNALQYIRYVRGHIHFVSYITIGKRCIHKFFQLEEKKFYHIWGWKIPQHNSLVWNFWWCSFL